MKKCPICKVVALLGGIGAVNWLLVAYFQLDLVQKLLGTMTTGAKIVYTLIGIAGILLIASVFKCCPCMKKCDNDPQTCKS